MQAIVKLSNFYKLAAFDAPPQTSQNEKYESDTCSALLWQDLDAYGSERKRTNKS